MLSDSRTICSGKIRSRLAARPIQVSTPVWTRTKSDYVARVSYQPNSTYALTSRFRFNSDTFEVQRTELEGPGHFRSMVRSIAVRKLRRPTRTRSFLDRRQGILGTAQIKLDANWVLLGSARYDINAGKFDQTRVGVGYVDDCLILG